MRFEAKLVNKLEQVFETSIKTFKNQVKEKIKDQNNKNKFDSTMEMFEEYINKEIKKRLDVCFTLINDEEGMFTREDMDKVVKEFEDQFQILLSLHKNESNYNILSNKLTEDFCKMQKYILDHHLIIKREARKDPERGILLGKRL